MLTMMKDQRQYTLENFEMIGIHARMLGPDTGVVAYTVHEKLTVEGKAVEIKAA